MPCVIRCMIEIVSSTGAPTIQAGSGQTTDPAEIAEDSNIGAEGESRRAPCPPELTKLLRRHLADVNNEPTALIFRGVQGRPLATITCRRVWDRARKSALSADDYNSPLARRPYDLRHACLSTWLNGGVAATQVAEWAGHSVEMLLRVYAKCLDGQYDVVRRRIAAALAEVE
jgi:integrase